jgi:hypothetical protein
MYVPPWSRVVDSLTRIRVDAAALHDLVIESTNLV